MAAEHEKFLLSQKVAKMSAQISNLREGSSTPSTEEPTSPEPATFDHIKIKQEIDDHIFSLSTPQLFSSPSTMTYSPSLSPSQPSLSFDGESLATSPDMTQHPAAMLCDLQCQSVEGQRQVKCHRCTEARIVTQLSSVTTIAIFLNLVSTVYSQLMIPLFKIQNSLAKPRTNLMGSHRSTRSARLTSLSQIPRTSRLTPWSTLILPTTTKTSTSVSRVPMISPSAPLTHRLRMLQRRFLSSPPLARPLKDATGRTLRGYASNMMSLSQRSCRRGHGFRGFNGSSRRTRQGRSVRSRRRGMSRDMKRTGAKYANKIASRSPQR